MPAKAGDFAKGPAPGWISPVDIPTLPDRFYRLSSDGVAYLLADKQARITEGGERSEVWYRVVTEVTNRSGLERAATLSRDFDPHIQSLRLVRVDILRGGERIDMLDRARIDVARRETGADAGIIDGTLTMIAQVPDVRVGDLVDVAVVWDGGSYLPGMAAEIAAQMDFGVPLAGSRFALDWPDDQHLNVTGTDDPRLVAETQPLDGGLTRHIWTLGATEGRWDDRQTPDGFSSNLRIRASAMTSWDAVTAPLKDHYNRAYPLPPSLAARVAAIAAENTSDDRRIHAALRLVQDRIRYVGVEVGAGGYFSRTPETVTEAGFGDCKDKALLLKTVLGALGIDAHVALARLEGGNRIDPDQPRHFAFDHMITVAMLNGQPVWLDPTRSFEGGTYLTSAPVDYGWVLPVTAGTDELTRTSRQDGPEPDLLIRETFAFADDGVHLRVRTMYRRLDANWQREKWATRPVRDIGQTYLDFYAAAYPGIVQTSTPKITDDLWTNALEMTESYLIPAAAIWGTDLWKDFPFRGEFAFKALPDPPPGGRRDPVGIASPRRVEHRIRVVDAPISFVAPTEVRIHGKAHKLDFTASAWGNGNMTLTWRTETLGIPELPASDLAAAVEIDDQIFDNRVYSWEIDAPKKSPLQKLWGEIEKSARELAETPTD